MRGSCLWLVQGAERIPPGMKFSFCRHCRGFGCVGRNHLVGELRLALIKQFPRQDTPLHPPGIRIDQCRGLTRRFQHEVRCFVVAFGATQIANLQELVGGIALPAAVDIRYRLGGVRRFLCNCRKGVVERLSLRRTCKQFCRLHAVIIERAQNTTLMVLTGQDTRELFQNLLLVIGRKALRSPPW